MLKNNSGKIEILVMTFFLLSFLIFIPDTIQASEDHVFLSPNTTPDKETHSCFVGEGSLKWTVVFGQNVTSWSIDIPSVLFTSNPKAIRSEPVKKGVAQRSQISINPVAPVGNHDLSLFLNYTTENQETVSRTFSYPMKYGKSIEVKKINKPRFFEKSFSIEVQVFTTFSELTVLFDSDGDVDVEPERLVFRHLEPGKYVFKTKVKKGISFAGDRQEISYDIRAVVDNHKIRVSEYNIPISLSVEEMAGTSVCQNLAAILIICIILLTVAFNRHRSLRDFSGQKQRMENGEDQKTSSTERRIIG